MTDTDELRKLADTLHVLGHPAAGPSIRSAANTLDAQVAEIERLRHGLAETKDLIDEASTASRAAVERATARAEAAEAKLVEARRLLQQYAGRSFIEVDTFLKETSHDG